MGADLGIGGGVATASFEIARALGAKTLVTSSSEEKLERAREWGADLAVPHAEAAAAAKELGGVDVVVETVGEATWKDSLGAVKPGGRVTVCGATSGPNPPAQLHRFWWKQLTIYGSTMGTRDDFLARTSSSRSGRARVPTSTRSSRSPKPEPPTSGWKLASNSGRSCFQSWLVTSLQVA